MGAAWRIGDAKFLKSAADFDAAFAARRQALRDIAQQQSSPGRKFYELYIRAASTMGRAEETRRPALSYPSAQREARERAAQSFADFETERATLDQRIGAEADPALREALGLKLLKDYSELFARLAATDKSLDEADKFFLDWGDSRSLLSIYGFDLRGELNIEDDCFDSFSSTYIEAQYAPEVEDYKINLVTDTQLVRFLVEGPQNQGPLSIRCPKSTRGQPSFRYDRQKHLLEDEWKVGHYLSAPGTQGDLKFRWIETRESADGNKIIERLRRLAQKEMPKP